MSHSVRQTVPCFYFSSMTIEIGQSMSSRTFEPKRQHISELATKLASIAFSPDLLSPKKLAPCGTSPSGSLWWRFTLRPGWSAHGFLGSRLVATACAATITLARPDEAMALLVDTGGGGCVRHLIAGALWYPSMTPALQNALADCKPSSKPFPSTKLYFFSNYN